VESGSVPTQYAATALQLHTFEERRGNVRCGQQPGLYQVTHNLRYVPIGFDHRSRPHGENGTTPAPCGYGLDGIQADSLCTAVSQAINTKYRVLWTIMRVVCYSRTLKVRGGIMSQANSSLGGLCSSQRIFPPQIIQVLLIRRCCKSQGETRGMWRW
jgi:hypothetical protein